MKTTRVWVACVLSLIWSEMSIAHAATATLTGRVTDSTGAVLPGATVTAAHVATNTTVSSVTNRDGIYVLANLATGTYRVTVELAGFQTMVKPDVQLHVQDTIALNFELPIGSVTDSVTVQGGAPLVKATAEVSTLVDRDFVENVPLNGRSVHSLVSLTPGVVLTKTTGEDAAGQFSINGQRTDANYFTVDGVSANASVQSGASFPGETGSGSLPALSALGTTQNLVAVDALQEFRVQTSTFAPEFGRMAGGQISMVTRAGTNAFHGSAFEYFRHDTLDANDWFGNSRGISKPEERQHDFGGVLGGPLQRDRAFFFASSEALRLRQPQVKLLAVPSLALRERAVAAARPYLDAFPLPTGRELPNGQAELLAAYTDPARLDANSIRLDYARSRLKFFGRFNRAPSNREIRSLSQVARTELNTNTLTVGVTWLARPDTTNDLRVNVSANDGVSRTRLDDFRGAVRPPDRLLYPIAMPGDRSDVLFAFAGNDASYSFGKQSSSEQHQLNIVDTLTRLAGAHQLKVGVDYRLLTPVFTSRPLVSLVFQSVAQASTGVLTRLNVGVGAEPRQPEFLNLSAYGQDSWQMTPRLTATYGVRWDYTPPPRVDHGRGPAALKDASDPRRIELAPS